MQTCNYCNRKDDVKYLKSCTHYGLWGICDKRYHQDCIVQLDYCKLHGYECVHCLNRVGADMMDMFPSLCVYCGHYTCGRGECFEKAREHRCFTMSRYCSKQCMTINIKVISKFIPEDLAKIVVKQYLSGTLKEDDRWLYDCFTD